jgi:ABC-type microcin C transport system permease subunit YejB
MARHILQRFLLTLPALWLVLALVFMLGIAPSGMCSFRMVHESR